jgi:hypothetical protein
VRMEPWRRFEERVDPQGQLDPHERARRAKISYKAFLRANARKAATSRLAKKHRREAALRRRLAAGPTAKQLANFERERDDFIRAEIIRAAAQRGEHGLATLARRQLLIRPDCLLCRRPFTEAEQAAASKA